ncbi:MAG: glycosyltransferase family 2 protein [Flavobacteriales bacterium]|nr:glycosyltransferase family 2 protein [Flavobacteriales bacterium]
MKVSVVIPCYNVEGWVEACLRSTLAQVHRDLEVICVDDGSTDGTAAVIEGLQAEQPGKITLIRQANSGATAARNRGLEAATGTYVQFLDADDLLLPFKLKRQLTLAEQRGLPGLIVGSYRTISADGRQRNESVQSPKDRDLWLDLMRTNLGITSANLWRRDTVVEAGGWNTELRSSQEYDLMYRMLVKGCEVAFDPLVNTVIRKRESGSISQSNLAANWKRYVDLRVHILEHVDALGVVKDRRTYLQYLFDSIRVLYLHDPKTALELFDRHIPKNFVPKPSPATGWLYVLAYRVLGFRRAQSLSQRT